MPAVPAKGLVLIVIELFCGLVIGSILATILMNAIDPVIVFIVIIVTIVAILDFAEYMPVFSLAYFAGYIGKFLSPGDPFGDLKVPFLLLAAIGIGMVVAVKAREGSDKHIL